jgi:hypothetical protein
MFSLLTFFTLFTLYRELVAYSQHAFSSHSAPGCLLMIVLPATLTEIGVEELVHEQCRAAGQHSSLEERTINQPFQGRA